VHCEDLLIDDCCNGQAVEAVCERLPELDIVSPLTFIIETIDTVDRGAFMVATQDEEILGVFDLVGKEEANGLERLLASVDIVPEEEIVCLRGEATILEQTEEVIILTMNVTTNLRARASSQPVASSSGLQLSSGNITYLDWRFKF